MSLLQHFYKKKILIIITIGIISSTILGSMSNLFIRNNQLPILEINKEKIYPEILKLNYYINKHINDKNIKNILSHHIQKQEYSQYIFKQTIIKLINESLLKQYVDKIDLHILKKHAIKIIMSSKYFQTNNSFDYTKYLKFINSIMYSNNKYVDALKKKIAVQYFIKILLKSMIILKSDINKKLKKIIDRKNIQITNFKIHLTDLIKKNSISTIKRSLYLNKDKFYNPEFYEIKIIHLKKKTTKKNLKYHTNLYLNQIKKKYHYTCIQTNDLKIAHTLIHKIKKNQDNKKINNIILKKNKKKFNFINLGWIKKKNIPHFIKNCHLKKIGDYSKIILYKNNFFIFKLNDIKYINTTKSEIIKNYIKKIIKFNNIFFKNIIKKNNLNFLLKNHHLKLKKLCSQKVLKIYITKPMIYKNLIKYSHSKAFNKYIKKNFSYKEIHNQTSPIKIYKNINNHIYLIQINSKKISNIQQKQIIYQEFLKNLILKTTQEKNSLLIKKFLLTNNNNKKNFLKKNHIYINQNNTLSYQKNKEIIKIIKQLPKPKKNNFIYFLLRDFRKNDTLIILTNEFFKKFNTIEKKIIIKQAKEYMKIKIINTILQNLYKKSKIIYNSNEK